MLLATNIAAAIGLSAVWWYVVHAIKARGYRVARRRAEFAVAFVGIASLLVGWLLGGRIEDSPKYWIAIMGLGWLILELTVRLSRKTSSAARRGRVEESDS